MWPEGATGNLFDDKGIPAASPLVRTGQSILAPLVSHLRVIDCFRSYQTWLLGIRSIKDGHQPVNNLRNLVYSSCLYSIVEFVHYEEPSIRCFTIHPGRVLTDLSRTMPENMHHILTDKPELAAGYTLWLATQQKADFLRGKFSAAIWDVPELLSRQAEVEANPQQFMTRVVGYEPIPVTK
jgi:hypothetical protein